jgi:hypothetical protein
MRIISKFNDYYDSAMAMGVDETVRWIRKEEETILITDQERGYEPGSIIPGKHNFFESDMYKQSPGSHSQFHRSEYLSREAFYFGVAGKMYPGFRFFWYNAAGYQNRYAFTTKGILQVLAEYDNIAKEHNAENFVNTPKSQAAMRKRYSNFWRGDRSSFTQRGMDAYFAAHSGSDKFLQEFIDYQAPVLLITIQDGRTPAKLITNPCAKDYGVQQIMDPYTMYQEIEMFISGVMGGECPIMATISDADMKQQKGFGHKYAFKKEPTKHK